MRIAIRCRLRRFLLRHGLRVLAEQLGLVPRVDMDRGSW